MCRKRPIYGSILKRWRTMAEGDEGASWRRGRDSNPRYGYPYAAFRVRCFQPLSHLSVAAEGANILSVGGYVSNATRLNKNGLSSGPGHRGVDRLAPAKDLTQGPRTV